MSEEQIKASLMSSNPEFHRLVKEHREYEGRLYELQAHHHLTARDLIEESALKKKKLHVKDRINAMILRFRSELTPTA